MGEIVINRGAQKIDLFSLIPFVTVTKAEHVQDLLSTDRITLSIASSQPMLFYLGDYIVYGGRKFTLNLNPTLQKQAEDVYLYDMQFEGVQYDLLRKKYFNYDAQGFYTTGDFPLTGEINVFLTALINNAKRDETNYTWILGEYPAGTETKTITFSNVNCLAALQTICQEYEQEFEIVQDMVAKTNTLYINKVGELRDYQFEYGYGNGLYSLKRDNVSEGQVITRLYPYGSTENIPTNYRNFSPRLRLPESYGTNYIQDNAKVALFGLVEEIKNYDDIKPTFKGIVSGVGTAVSAQNTFDVVISNMDFDLNEKKADGVSTKYLIDGTPAKMHVNKGNLAGYEFEIHKYTHATKTFEIKVFADERGQKFPDLSTIFKFAIGDEITLLDIIMPDVYITNAENKLKDKALEDYDKLSQNNVKYSLDIDPMFFANIGGGTDVAHLTIGDYISVKDSALGIQKTSRVISLNRDLLANDGYKYSAEISDSYEISIVTQILQDIQSVQTQVGVVVVRNKEAMLAGYQRMKELQGLVFDPDGYFDPTNIKPNSIETNMLTVGAKSQQLSLESVIIKTNVNNDPNSVSITAGKLIHFSISDTGIKEWNLTAINKTLPTNEAYYIYAKVPRTGTTGTFNIVTSKLKFDSEDLYYNFLVAVVFAPSNGIRMTELMYGSTFIHGRTITTGRIQSVDGLTWFDLDTGQIKGKIEFLPDSPAYNQIANTITVGSRNLVLKSNELKGINQSGYIIWEFAEQMLGKYTFQIWCENTVDNSAGIGFGSASGRDMDYFSLPEIKNGVVKFTVDNLNSGSNRYLWLWVNNTTNITKIKVEKGSVGTDWTPAPEDVEEQISIAENTAIVANQLLADIANDNKLTASEKQLLKKEYDLIISEKPQIQAQANTYGVSTTAYINAYNALISYTNPLLVNLNTTDDIVGSVLRNTFNNYYTAKVNLLKAVTDKVNDNFSDVYEEMDRIEQDLSAEIEDVNQSVSNLNSYVDGAFSDGIISAAEAVAIEKYINQLNTEKGDIEQKYNQIYNDTFLTGTPKNELSGAFGTAINGGSGYLGAHNNLISSISIAIADGLTTPAEKSDVDSKFVLYKDALMLLTTKFQSALSAIEQAKINAIQVGGRNLFQDSQFIRGFNVLVEGSSGLDATFSDTDQDGRTSPLGHKVLRLFRNGSGDNFIYIAQTVIVDPNTEYTVSFYQNGAGEISANSCYIRYSDGTHQVLDFTLNKTTSFVRQKVTFTTKSGITTLQLRFGFQSTADAWITISSIKLEKGNKATDWTPANEDINEQITSVQTYATAVNNLVSDIANDNKITPSEKQSLKKEYDIIIAEKPQISAQATPYLITAEKTAYDTAYNNLITFVNPLIVNLNNTSDVDGVTLRSRFTSYYTAKVNLLKAITDKVDNDLSDILNEMEDLQNSVNQEIADVTQQVNNLEGYVDGAFSDGIINQAEAVAIEKYINQINTEKSDIDNKYNQIYNDSYLSGTTKTNLSTDYNNYVSAHTNLINSINTAISDGATTPAEKSDVDSKFSTYRLAVGVLTTRFQEAIKAIETATVNAIQIGGRNLFRDSIFTKGFNLIEGNGEYRNTDYDNKPNPFGRKGFGLFGSGDFYGYFNQQIPILPNTDYTLSFYLKTDGSGGNSSYIQYNDGSHQALEFNQNYSPDVQEIKTTFRTKNNVSWIKLRFGFNSNFLTWSVFSSIKLEKGNKATDWSPAPEDVDADITTANTNSANALAQAQNALNTASATAAVTSFMQTTIDGNVVSTGTLQVGDVNGANAGITGVTDNADDSIRFFAGSTYQNKSTAPWSMSGKGIERTYHPNGNIATIRGIINGEFTFNFYHKNGYLLFKLDPNRGLINVAYTNESFTEYNFAKLNIISQTASDLELMNAISPLVTTSNSYYVIDSNQLTYICYEYFNGTLPENSTWEQYNGYKASKSKLDNIPDGWYITMSGILFLDSSGKPTATAVYFQNGVQRNQKIIVLTNF